MGLINKNLLIEKFLKIGENKMTDKEIFLLYLSFYVSDVGLNNVFEKLISKFGSICGIFNADIEELMNIEGLDSRSSIFIKILPGIIKVCNDEYYCKKVNFSKEENIKNLIKNKYFGVSKETIILILFNEKMKIQFCDNINEGSFNTVNIYIREIANIAIKYSSRYAIIAHNHPSGNAIPSSTDIETTDKINDALSIIGVTLIDHYIVCDNKITSFNKAGLIRK